MAYREGSACARCESTATTADGRCLACGHIWGDAYACVHCHVVAPIVADRITAATCAACGMPRIAAGWEMPPDIAEGLRRAVARQRRARRITRIAVVGAILCMPLGPLAAVTLGFAGWLAVLVLWGVCIMASTARRIGQRQLATTIARAERAHLAVTGPRLRVETEISSEPTGSESDPDAVDPDAVEDEPLARHRR